MPSLVLLSPKPRRLTGIQVLQSYIPIPGGSARKSYRRHVDHTSIHHVGPSMLPSHKPAPQPRNDVHASILSVTVPAHGLFPTQDMHNTYTQEHHASPSHSPPHSPATMSMPAFLCNSDCTRNLPTQDMRKTCTQEQARSTEGRSRQCQSHNALQPSIHVVPIFKQVQRQPVWGYSTSFCVTAFPPSPSHAHLAHVQSNKHA